MTFMGLQVLGSSLGWATSPLGHLGRSPSGSGRPRAGLGPGRAIGGSQVQGKAAAWPFSKYIQSQPKGNPDSVSAGTPGAQALETLNIKHVGWLPSLVIKTLISYFTQDGQGGHGAALRGFIASLFTDEAALPRKNPLTGDPRCPIYKVVSWESRVWSSGRAQGRGPPGAPSRVSDFLLLQSGSVFPGACRGLASDPSSLL